MANVKTILDTRRAKSDGTFNVIFRITHFKKIYTINSGVSVYEMYWDNSIRRISKAHPNSKHLNLKLSKDYYKIEQALLILDDEFTIDRLRAKFFNKSGYESTITFKKFTEHLIYQMIEVGSTGNALVYRTAMNKLIAYCGEDIAFNNLDYKLLTQFKHHLEISGLKVNSVSNYFRSIRAIYNKAIKEKVVDRSFYPFYDITIKSERTPKRAISKEDIQKLTQLSLDEHSTAWKSLNYFLLSFYLRGISLTDLAYLKPSNIIDGRIHYKRRKTHKNYSIRLFTPADELIKNLGRKDRSNLLPVLPNNIVEDSLEAKKIIKQWIKTTNKYLKRLSVQINCKISITTNSSRHGYATIAKHLGYSNELIAESLGHLYGNRTTRYYLDDFNQKTLDNMHYDVIFLDIPSDR